jgi:EAL domain-containing protein (putative c-di-GMP-specific phosphodiesterase class I)
VNLSPSQFAQPLLVEQVAEVLQETGLEPSSLRLEITESVLTDDHDLAREILTRLKGLGVGLKIDDFGTGYSSLAYLAQLPFDTMKIDRSFTLQLQGGDCNSEIVRSILDMAHTLGMQVVAEGVEENEQITRLISMGCEFGQGFFFSKPVSRARCGAADGRHDGFRRYRPTWPRACAPAAARLGGRALAGAGLPPASPCLQNCACKEDSYILY